MEVLRSFNMRVEGGRSDSQAVSHCFDVEPTESTLFDNGPGHLGNGFGCHASSSRQDLLLTY